MTRIIVISEVIEQKHRKEKELQFYREKLEKIQGKIAFLQRDLDITNLCIEIIEQEKDQLFKGDQ